MSPPMAIPGHITALYVFAIINLMVMCHFTMVEANVYVLDQRNFSVYEAEDKMAKFGGQLPDRGLRGYLQPTIPQNACSEVKAAPPQSTYPWIALIQRNGCDFSFKVYMAQRAGYTAAIVYNIGSDELVPMGAGKDSDKVRIPSVFIGAHDGEVLRNLSIDSVFQHTVLIFPHFSDLPLRDMLVPFIICVGICCLIMIGVLVGKWVRDWRKRRKARLSKQNLKKLPVKKFKKGDEYDMCAICLDEYEDGDKLRILPCQHAYHMKCVDPWLLNNRRVCPVCKRKVIPGDDSDSNSDSEDESNGNETTNERTPLLAPQDQNASRPRSFFSRTYENSGLPESMRDEVRTAGSAAPVSDDDGSTTSPSPQGGGHSVQSTVDVHHSGEHEEPSARRPSVDMVNEGPGPSKAAKTRLHRKKRSSRIKVKRPQPGLSGHDDEQARSPLDHPTTHRPTEPLVPPGGSINCDDYKVRVVTGEEQQANVEELGAVGGLDHPLVTLVDDHFAQEPVETPQVADEQTASDTEAVPKVRSSTKIKKKRKRRKRDEEA